MISKRYDQELRKHSKSVSTTLRARNLSMTVNKAEDNRHALLSKISRRHPTEGGTQRRQYNPRTTRSYALLNNPNRQDHQMSSTLDRKDAGFWSALNRGRSQRVSRNSMSAPQDRTESSSPSSNKRTQVYEEEWLE